MRKLRKIGMLFIHIYEIKKKKIGRMVSIKSRFMGKKMDLNQILKESERLYHEFFCQLRNYLSELLIPTQSRVYN